MTGDKDGASAGASVSSGDILHELDRVLIATRNQRLHEPQYYDPAYLAGLEDGLTGFRNLVRSAQFARLVRHRRRGAHQETHKETPTNAH